MKNKNITIASFFAGVGGIDLGFHLAGGFETVYANEFDPYPADTFRINFPIEPDVRDIHEVKPGNFPDVDLICGGFPCQAFSVAGLRQGFADEKDRGKLFFQLARLIEAKKPRAIFLENVKNLVGHDKGNTFRVICEELERLGYYYTYHVLNASEYGNIAQNRERIYIVGFRDKNDYASFKWPLPVPLTGTVKDIISFTDEVDEKYYYRKGKYKGEIFELLTEAMAEDDPDDPSVYQWRRKYVRKNQSHQIPTLTANQGEGGHNVCLVKTAAGIRKMTPRECFRAQGFPDLFKLPPNQADSRLYKQAGNSVCVSVITRIAQNIRIALEDSPKK